MSQDVNKMMNRFFSELLNLNCNSVPFLTLPPDIKSYEELMEFDRKGCEVFKKFRRHASPFDNPQPEHKVLSNPSGRNPMSGGFRPGWVVLVAEFQPPTDSQGAGRMRIPLEATGEIPEHFKHQFRKSA